ncbi:hypothetical protein FZ029_32110 [Azospirillum sp. Sh1]|nr:hypothetical protein FZ029_32110 [Azospirillum sp. Sh1]
MASTTSPTTTSACWPDPGSPTTRAAINALSRPGRGRGPAGGGEGEGESKNPEAHGSLHHPSPFPPLRGGPLPSPGTGEGNS